MNLYLISQTENQNYDTYDSAIVAAISEDEARFIHPAGEHNYGWCAPENVAVKYIGKTAKGTEAGVILASFNAG